MFYVRVWARPMGAEPKVFKTKEEAEIKCDGQCDPEFGCSPWCEPHIMEFETKFEAWRWIKEMYPMCYKERWNHVAYSK